MSEQFDLEAPDAVVADAVGEPGRRTFYLQGRQGREIVSLKLEKQQVAALCEYLSGLLNDLPPAPPLDPSALALVEPVMPAFTVGSLAVAYQEATDRILIVAEELVLDEEEDDEDDVVGELFGPEHGLARFHLTRAQVAALVAHGLGVVGQGRPPCPLCGRPIDPSGHACPRLN